MIQQCPGSLETGSLGATYPVPSTLAVILATKTSGGAVPERSQAVDKRSKEHHHWDLKVECLHASRYAAAQRLWWTPSNRWILPLLSSWTRYVGHYSTHPL